MQTFGSGSARRVAIVAGVRTPFTKAGTVLKPMSAIEPEAVAALECYPWPGNVRELENVLERGLILAGDGPIRAEHLTLGVAPRSRNVVLELLVPGFDLDGFERELLHAAMERASGNKSAAARLLGITRRRLYSRLDSLAAQDEGDSEG